MAFIILMISESFAEIYFSAGASLYKTNNLEINAKDDVKLYKDFTSMSSITENPIVICSKCTGGNGVSTDTHDFIIYRQTIKNETSNYSASGFQINLPASYAYSFAMGYRVKQNFRIEGEYRLANSKKQFNSLPTNFNAKQSIIINNMHYCEGGLGDDPDICRNNYSVLNSTTTYENSFNFSEDLFSLIPQSNGEASYINFANNISYYFLNFFYDAPVFRNYFGFFGGLGIGYAQIKLNTSSNLEIDLKGNAAAPAYQYKTGAYYNISDSFRLLLSFTHINTIGDIKFSNFTMQPISHNSIDFNLMYLL